MKIILRNKTLLVTLDIMAFVLAYIVVSGKLYALSGKFANIIGFDRGVCFIVLGALCLIFMFFMSCITFMYIVYKNMRNR